MNVHEKPTPTGRRWIGIVRCLGGVFHDHCLVMTRDGLLYDPIGTAVGPDGRRIRLFGPEDIAFGLTFQRTTTRRT